MDGYRLRITQKVAAIVIRGYHKHMRYRGRAVSSFIAILLGGAFFLALAGAAETYATSPGYNGRLLVTYSHPSYEGRTRSNISILPNGNSVIDYASLHSAHGFVNTQLLFSTTNGDGFVGLLGRGLLDGSAWSPWPNIGMSIEFAFTSCSDDRFYFRTRGPQADGWYIYSMKHDGTSVQHVATVDGTNLSCSPDGKYLAFVENVPSEGGGNFSGDLYLLETATGLVTQLTYGRNLHVNGHAPSWSPDGKKIAYTVYTGQPSDPDKQGVWEVDTVTKVEQRLVTLGSLSRPIYSPDGKTVVVYSIDNGMSCWQNGGRGICLMDADGTNLRAFPHPNPYNAVGQASFATSWASIPNTPPILTSKSLVLSPTESGAVDVLDGATDEEPLDPGLVSIVTQPAHGQAVLSNGEITYAPYTHFAGSDSVQYQVCDSFILDQKCATGTLAITVNPGPTPPKPVVTQVAGGVYSGQLVMAMTDRRPLIAGTAFPFADIRVEIHSDIMVLTTTADSHGNWSVVPYQDLLPGQHMVYITTTYQGSVSETMQFGLTIWPGVPNTGVKRADSVLAYVLILMGGGLLVFIRYSMRSGTFNASKDCPCSGNYR